jgi:hypothetical protein
LEFRAKVEALFGELLEHMRIESGEQIPRLEALLDGEESRRLGREYVKTQVLGPDLMVEGPGWRRRRVWRDVEDYVGTDLRRFREVWEDILAGRVRVVGGQEGDAKGKL